MPDDAPPRDPVQTLPAVLTEIGQVVRGKPEAIRLVIAAIMARGHVLLEDVPGVGKTTLARAVAKVLGCSFSRIQFTSDLLPSDVTGVQILDPKEGLLRFRRGPLFAHLVLADEINRASPKTQSALLEAMADNQVSVDDETYPLLPPFSVMATQNPVEHHGAYPLPESQLDRFMVSLSLGYPAQEHERSLLMAHQGATSAVEAAEVFLDPESIRTLQSKVQQIQLGEAVADYLLNLVTATRSHPDVSLGCSPRGALAWAQLARATALLNGRSFVAADDVKALALPVLVHRLALAGTPDGAAARQQCRAIVEEIVTSVAAPR